MGHSRSIKKRKIFLKINFLITCRRETLPLFTHEFSGVFAFLVADEGDNFNLLNGLALSFQSRIMGLVRMGGAGEPLTSMEVT